jgi:hypothetical protein
MKLRICNIETSSLKHEASTLKHEASSPKTEASTIGNEAFYPHNKASFQQIELKIILNHIPHTVVRPCTTVIQLGAKRILLLTRVYNSLVVLEQSCIFSNYKIMVGFYS